MKAIFLLSFGLVHVVSLGQLPSVTNQPPSDGEIRRMVIGTWGVDGNDRHARLTFATNGTYVSTNWVTARAVRNFVSYAEGTWRVQDGVLVSTVTKTTDPPLCPLGSVWRTKLLLINETGMAGITQFGTTNTVARIK